MRYNMLPQYNSMTFSGVFPSLSDFILKLADVNPQNASLDDNLLFKGMTDDDVIMSYFLLSSEYADAPINSDSVDHFILKLAYIMNNYGPIWAKKRKLRAEMQLVEDLAETSTDKEIRNYADNPATYNLNGTLDESIIKYINSQNAALTIPSKIKAYENYVDYFDTITNELDKSYISKFKVLFLRFVLPQRTFIYVDDVEEE